MFLVSPRFLSSVENEVPLLKSSSFLNDAFSKSGTDVEVPELRIFAEFNRFQAKQGSHLTLEVRVFIPDGWHLYSIQKTDSKDFFPTQLRASSKVHLLKNALRENPPVLEWDSVLEKQVYLHKEELMLEQDYLISQESPEGIQDLVGELIFQACNNNVCVPLSRQSFTAALVIMP